MYFSIFYGSFYGLATYINFVPDGTIAKMFFGHMMLYNYIAMVVSLLLVFFCSWLDMVGVGIITIIYFGMAYIKYNFFNEIGYKERGALSKLFFDDLHSFVKYEYLNELNYNGIADSNYLITVHPHGVWPSSALHYLTDPLIKNFRKSIMTVHSVIFYAPFIREAAYDMGLRDCTEKTITDLLNSDCNVIIAPGGEREVVNMQKNVDIIYIKRKGIFRISLETGKPIIPIISYNENDLYENLNLPWFRNFLKKYLNTSLMLCWGNFPCFWKPKNVTVKMCCGNPIIPQLIEGTTLDEKIKNYRKVYVEMIKKMHKKYSPDPSKEFIIIS